MSEQPNANDRAREVLSRDLRGLIAGYREWQTTGIISSPDIAEARDILWEAYGASGMSNLNSMIGELMLNEVERLYEEADAVQDIEVHPDPLRNGLVGSSVYEALEGLTEQQRNAVNRATTLLTENIDGTIRDYQRWQIEGVISASSPLCEALYVLRYDFGGRDVLMLRIICAQVVVGHVDVLRERGRNREALLERAVDYVARDKRLSSDGRLDAAWRCNCCHAYSADGCEPSCKRGAILQAANRV